LVFINPFSGPITSVPGILDSPINLIPKASDAVFTSGTTGSRGNVFEAPESGKTDFSGLVKDAFGSLTNAGINRLATEITGFTRDSIDSIERDSFESLDKKQRQKARAVSRREQASRKSLLVVSGTIGAVALLALLLFRR